MTGGAPHISCIIPVCDREDFIGAAVQCALNQTLQPNEILVIDNGWQPVRAVVPCGDKIQYYRILPYAGVAQAANFGASLAQGDYLAFLEDDDLWNERYLENVVRAIEQGASCTASRLDRLVNDRVCHYKNSDGKLSKANLLIRNPGVSLSATTIAKDLFYAVGGFDPKLVTAADKGLFIEVLRHGAKVVALPDNQVLARFHTRPRLGKNFRSLLENAHQFGRKYGSEMSVGQRCRHRWRTWYYRYRLTLSIVFGGDPQF